MEEIVVKAIEAMRRRGFDVHAVQDAQQARELTALGCDAMQGYYFARPMPPEDFEALLRGAAAEPDQLSAAPVMET